MGKPPPIRQEFEHAVSWIRVNDINHFPTQYVCYALTVAVILATDLISECSYFKSFKNWNSSVKKITREVKLN